VSASPRTIRSGRIAVVALHFAVSTSKHVIQEEMIGAVPWYFEAVRGPIETIDGFWQVPIAMALGVEDEAGCAPSFRARSPLCRQRHVDDRANVEW
jgi:galactonate dehydratase